MAHPSLVFFGVLASTLLRCAVGQTVVVATNGTTGVPDQSEHNVHLSVSMGDSMVPMAKLLPLTQAASSDLPPPGLSGPTLLVNNSNQLDIKNRDIVVINCDLSAYPGNIGPLDIFATAEQRNATGVVWYSREADWCDLQDYDGSYKWIYTMKDMNDTDRVLDKIDNWSNNDGDSIYATIGHLDSEQLAAGDGSGSGDNGDGGDNDNDNDQNTTAGPPGSDNLGSSPTTAVAMIILYSVTGIVTALFLCIIITGAVRAHRHPERYGPRNILGRARQSRAKGLARAMLDTIPIVKFGGDGVEGGKGTTGAGDVEMAEGGGTAAAAATLDDSTAGRDGASPSEADGRRETDPHHDDETGAGSPGGTNKAGVTTATSPSTSPHNPAQPHPHHDLDNQGCSICTDDFEIGQDQRVLPCNHRFHPACIDPWLLNVSGTCPLCRIDLRPTQTAEGDGEQEQELDENGNPIPPRPNGDDEQLPPPLGSEAGAGVTTTQRMGVRRSLVVGILGLRGAPERMSREERVGALRAYRERQAVLRRGRGGGEVDAARGQEGVGAEAEDGVVGSPASPQQELNGNENENEDENGARLRDRLRRTFRIRTRRAGGPGPGPTARGRGEEEEEVVGETIPATTTATAAAADGGTRRPNVTS
ncbi:hypothetical protein KC332_g3384 [Hortaea werneckii]|uniref:RING-type E3 ubiquitin transferase n=2 Tax=Hortaea werneckii TaxID=91943 RepID=A0A3M7I829_HORWE|nr:hypothetical protein KC358_g3436 [Hortaea werneckii]OTA22518.1 hypothetical protein BTJ68_14940 [Hortaea werneckii EXF-2000]KAI6848914.1 hypothetical protein KC350_g2821 [Hortaea werneckii]KAI6919065.1 hypothetical protein KC348_g10712 [Hortaea werneckii]KAI6934001.1 hypothetical protein KC341_g7891 [Hortaea werneckii]